MHSNNAFGGDQVEEPSTTQEQFAYYHQINLIRHKGTRRRTYCIKGTYRADVPTVSVFCSRPITVSRVTSLASKKIQKSSDLIIFEESVSASSPASNFHRTKMNKKKRETDSEVQGHTS